MLAPSPTNRTSENVAVLLHFGVEFIDIDELACFGAVLFAAGFKYCVCHNGSGRD